MENNLIEKQKKLIFLNLYQSIGKYNETKIKIKNIYIIIL